MQIIDEETLINEEILEKLKDRYEYFKIENFELTFFHYNKDIEKKKFYHKHPEYEFFVLLTPINGILIGDDNFVGETDVIYPVNSEQYHGVAENIDSKKSYIDIRINKEYFLKMLEDMGVSKNKKFNSNFPFDRKLALYIIRFSKIYNSNNIYKQELLNELKELICKEIIYLGLCSDRNKKSRAIIKKEKFSSIANYIATNYNRSDVIENAAQMHNYTVNSLSKLFAKYYNISIHQFVLKTKLSNAKMLLKYTELSIDKIAKECGFTGSKYFSEIFIKKNNITPSQYRKNYKGISEMQAEKNVTKRSIKKIINDELIIYCEICYNKNEIKYDDDYYSYLIIPASLMKINNIIVMPKNILKFDAKTKLKIDSIKNSTFFVLAIKKEIVDYYIEKFSLKGSDMPFISSTFFLYMQEMISTTETTEAKSLLKTIYNLLKTELIYAYIENSDLFYEEIKEIVDENLSSDDIVSIICKQKGYIEKDFKKKFQRKFKVTPHQFLIHCRLSKAKELLKNTTMKVEDVAKESGFVSLNSLMFYMKTRNNTTPAQYRRKIKNQRR